MITYNQKFMECMYDFEIDYFRYTSIKKKNYEKNEELESARISAKTKLLEMINIAEDEARHNSEFRNWLIWNEFTYIQRRGVDLCMFIDKNYATSLPKVPRAFSSNPSQQMTEAARDLFQRSLIEYDHKMDVLRKRHPNAALRKSVKNFFISILLKIDSVSELYDEFKIKLKEDYGYIIRILTQYDDVNLKRELACEWHKFYQKFGDEVNDDDTIEFLREKQNLDIIEKLKQMSLEKIHNFRQQILQKTPGTIQEAAKNKIKELLKVYFGLSHLFSKTSLNMNGIIYFKNHLSFAKQQFSVWKYDSRIEVSKVFLLICGLLILTQFLIFGKISIIFTAAGCVVLVPTILINIFGNILQQYELYLDQLFKEQYFISGLTSSEDKKKQESTTSDDVKATDTNSRTNAGFKASSADILSKLLFSIKNTLFSIKTFFINLRALPQRLLSACVSKLCKYILKRVLCMLYKHKVFSIFLLLFICHIVFSFIIFIFNIAYFIYTVPFLAIIGLILILVASTVLPRDLHLT